MQALGVCLQLMCIAQLHRSLLKVDLRSAMALNMCNHKVWFGFEKVLLGPRFGLGWVGSLNANESALVWF